MIKFLLKKLEKAPNPVFIKRELLVAPGGRFASPGRMVGLQAPPCPDSRCMQLLHDQGR
jgi:hypothetical protein